MINIVQKFMGLFKKEETPMERMQRWEKENKEIQRLNESHEKASKNRTPKKKKSKPVNYTL